jgi:cardiolipin synthase
MLFRKRTLSKKERKAADWIIKEMEEYPKSEKSFLDLSKEDSFAAGKALAILNEDKLSSVYRDTSATFYSTGESIFEAIISDLKAAKKYIFVESFIVDLGYVWDTVHDILKQKVKEGVEVRMLYDDVGAMGRLPSHCYKDLQAEGIDAYSFGVVSPVFTTAHNNRDHRKIIVVDGKIGYTGGINLADEYINRVERFGHWKDGGIRLEGMAVRGLIELFLVGYTLASGKSTDFGKYLLDVSPSENADNGYYLVFGSGPDPMYKEPVGKNAFINVINQAKDYIYITTPYLIIDFDLTEALRGAAKRGVDVRIITPNIPDKPLVKLLTESSYPYLMQGGVSIFEYTPGFIHEKNLICDDKYAIIGTINLDYRSLVHNYEDAVWMYNAPIIETMRNEFMNTLSVSSLVTRASAKHTLKEKIVRTVVKMFAPLL